MDLENVLQAIPVYFSESLNTVHGQETFRSLMNEIKRDHILSLLGF